MTEEEGNFYIALAMLHAPSTTHDVASGSMSDPNDPFRHDCGGWWVYRDNLCSTDFHTRAEAAKHYCKHYGLLQE